MNWTYEEWTKDDNNLGFPYITHAGYPTDIDIHSMRSIFTISEDKNLGFPCINVIDPPNSIDISKTNSIWEFSNSINLGFPYIRIAIPSINPYNMYIGNIPVQEIYIGEELIWKLNGINKIIM